MIREGILIVALALPLLVLLGCGGPEREIRARLSDAEREHFDRGQRLSTPCWSCHDLYGEQNKVGPYLSGLYGRAAGSARFGGYSESMRRSGVVWDDRSLASFLMNPTAFIPGTTMVGRGPGSSADTRALVFYLKLVTASDGQKK